MAPEDYRKAAGLPFRTAHLAYQIGEDGRLHRRSARQTQGGLMALSDPAAPPIRESGPLCREILRTCINHAFEGVCADFGPQRTPDRAAFLAELGPLLQRSSKKLFVSAAYGRTVPSAHVLVNTALSYADKAQRARSLGGRRIAAMAVSGALALGMLTSAVCALSMPENQGKIAFFAGIDKAKFRRQVLPGDTLRLEVEMLRVRGNFGMGKGTATVGGERAASAEITFALMK